MLHCVEVEQTTIKRFTMHNHGRAPASMYIFFARELAFEHSTVGIIYENALSQELENDTVYIYIYIYTHTRQRSLTDSPRFSH
jgi:hypothetical protein